MALKMNEKLALESVVKQFRKGCARMNLLLPKATDGGEYVVVTAAGRFSEGTGQLVAMDVKGISCYRKYNHRAAPLAASMVGWRTLL